MDSEVLKFIATIFITLLVAGGDQLIKSIKKKAARKNRAASRTSAPTTRKSTPPVPPPPHSTEVHQESPWHIPGAKQEIPQPLLSQLPEEGARITEDVSPMKSIPVEKPAVRLSLNDDLKKAFIWSEILKRKF